jgi:hypothetical protein
MIMIRHRERITDIKLARFTSVFTKHAVQNAKNQKETNMKIDKICPKDLRVEDEVAVEFIFKINHIAGKDNRTGQVFGFTEDGMCVSAPISAIVERFPRLGNGAEEIDNGEVF